ncbi:hypothetical protein C0991_001462 [Blastosporella zonata]|nr:hypothetical protein C0991_001462 [Blastosporella zonata]
MTILITGGTGNTGMHIAKRLYDAKYPVLLTQHSKPVPPPFTGVQFDWFDETTYENPFTGHTIESIYIVCPPVYDMLAATRPFIDLCVEKKVKRFVLISGTAVPKGSPIMGKVHEYIVGLKVDYCVLRPTGFQELFDTAFLTSIRDGNYVASAAKDGREPLVAVDDIATVGFEALTDEKSHNTEHIIVGPELFSYDQAVALISEVIGRKIVHKRLRDQQCLDMHLATGAEPKLAEALLGIDKFMAEGKEEALFFTYPRIVGYGRFIDYLHAHKEIWAPKK